MFMFLLSWKILRSSKSRKINSFSVSIDQHISRKPHISFLSKTISKSVEIIAKACFYLSYLLVYLYLTYCNVVWSSTNSAKTVFIITFAKAYRVRLITEAHYLENTAPLFRQLKVLDIFSINSFCCYFYVIESP